MKKIKRIALCRQTSIGLMQVVDKMSILLELDREYFATHKIYKINNKSIELYGYRMIPFINPHLYIVRKRDIKYRYNIGLYVKSSDLKLKLP